MRVTQSCPLPLAVAALPEGVRAQQLLDDRRVSVASELLIAERRHQAFDRRQLGDESTSGFAGESGERDLGLRLDGRLLDLDGCLALQRLDLRRRHAT